jgi:sterol carrier protein 2
MALGFERMRPGSLSSNFPDRVPPTVLWGQRSGELEEKYLGENNGPHAPRMFDNGAQEYFMKYGGDMVHLAKIGMLYAEFSYFTELKIIKPPKTISIP